MMNQPYDDNPNLSIILSNYTILGLFILEYRKLKKKKKHIISDFQNIISSVLLLFKEISNKTVFFLNH